MFYDVINMRSFCWFYTYSFFFIFRQIVSRLMFAITKDKKRYSSWQIRSRTRKEINRQASMFLKAMPNKYTVTNVSPWFDLDMKFDLYFTTKLSTLDFTKLGTALLTTLKSSWKGKCLSSEFYIKSWKMNLSEKHLFALVQEIQIIKIMQ